MTKTINYNRSKANKVVLIEQKYVEVKILGSMNTHYKNGPYSCSHEYKNGCDFIRDCPYEWNLFSGN